MSDVTVTEGKDANAAATDFGAAVKVTSADGEKCERCWVYSPSVGEDAGHPTLCSRCAAIMEKTTE